MASEPNLSQPHDRGQAEVGGRLSVPNAVPLLFELATQ